MAVLSCTDCSGSSTASSDITDPGSPFSTASNHSDDSVPQSAKMPPTQNTHHSPWSWNREDRPLLVQETEDKRRKSDPSSKTGKPPRKQEKMHQGKITEYFKTHVKGASMRKKSNLEFNNLKSQNVRRCVKKQPVLVKSKKYVPVTVPRKILPAPAKTETITIRNNVNNIINFPLALSTVNFTPNLTYLHTKVPKPPDTIFAPQFASITDKINAAIPIINRTQCLNVIHPKIVNNFNCVKLNATVVPIVKVNNMPSKINGSLGGQPLETTIPTVLTPEQLKINECQPVVCPAMINIGALASVNQCIVSEQVTIDSPMDIIGGYQSDLGSECQGQGRVSECQSSEQANESRESFSCDRTLSCTSSDDSGVSSEVCSDRSCVEKSLSSDSGVSDCLEVKVNVPVAVEPQKSPILSKPKTIRFPFKKQEIERRDSRKSLSGGDSARCRWADCTAQFDTSGALLEHLQVYYDLEFHFSNHHFSSKN